MPSTSWSVAVEVSLCVANTVVIDASASSRLATSAASTAWPHATSTVSYGTP
jgi:hypothetical protein